MSDVVLYRRVSTLEQGESGAGLEAQQTTLQTASRQRGWNIIDSFHDIVSGSGKKPLPGRDAAIARCVETGAALVAAKLDRLGRSALDVHRIDELARKEGFSLVLLDLGIDTGTPMGRAMMGMAAVFAQLERDMIGQRTREGLAVKRAQGVRIGRPPTIDPYAEKLAFELFADGWNRGQVAGVLRRTGAPTPQGGSVWRYSSLEAVWRRFQAGVMQ